METPDDEQADNLKSPSTDLLDTNPSSVTIHKKPIQLGVVQSSTGSRPPPGNVSPWKKSRWDQAPGSGECEQNTKETNVQLNDSGESSIKNLIKKFEDISGGSKFDSNKIEEIPSNKPSRVKLVRTNFTKPDNPEAKPITTGKLDIEASTIEETNLKVIETSTEVPEADLVSSSKALQIISSNYDSTSDDSQEADNVTEHQAPPGSSFSSLDILPVANVHEERIVSTEEKLNESSALENKSSLKPGDEEINDEKSECLVSQTELEQDDFVVVENIEQTDTENAIEMVLQTKSEDLEIEAQGVEIVKETLEEIVGNENTEVNQNEELVENKIPYESQEIDESSVPLNENIPNFNNPTKDEIENSTNMQCYVVGIVNAEEQPENIESADTKINDTGISKVVSEIEEPIENLVDKNSTLVSHSNKTLGNDDVDVVKEPIQINTPGETTSSFDEEVKDFVIITHAELEGYIPDNISDSMPNYTLKHHEKSSTSDELTKGNIKEKSSFDNKLKNVGGTSFSTKTFKGVTLENNEAETSYSIEQKSNDKYEIQLAPDEPVNDDKTQVYNDGVDAKMAQIFCETSGTVMEKSICPKNVIEENFSPAKMEQDADISISDTTVAADKHGNQEPENLLETNDSLLEMLESGGSPESVDHIKESSSSDIVMEAKKPVEELKSLNIVSEDVAETGNIFSVEEKSVSKYEMLKKNSIKGSGNEEITNAIIFPEGSMLDTTKEFSVESEIVLNNNEEILNSLDNPNEKSETVIDSNTKGSNIVLDKEDGQFELQNESDGLKEVDKSDILVEEVEDIQSPNVISEISTQILEPKEECNVTLAENGSSDVQFDMEVVSETDKDIIIEEVVCTETEVNSEITELEDQSKLQSFKTQSPKVEEIIIEPVEPSESLKSNDNMSNLKSEFVDKNIDKFTKHLGHTESVKDKEMSINPEGNNVVEEKLDIKSNVTKSVDGTNPEELLNESEQVVQIEHETLSDSLNNQVELKQTSKNTGGSIEVSQQETIERSVDMFFDVPNNEQPLDSNTGISSSSTQGTELEVSNETKKIFSEEIHKEMLKLSPEHKEMSETDQLPQSIENNSYSKTSETKNQIQSEDTGSIVSDSCALPDKTGLDDGKTFKQANELDKEKEILEASDDSDIATIQAIDSFLQGDSTEVDKIVPDSKSEDRSVNIDESQIKITMPSNEDDSDLFTGSGSTNEKTNAEDVLLGIEGDLDLDNSLTYDEKKLDLSPSSEPSISEENYDLPGDSYDKESLVKEQENTNLMSDVLDDVDVNTKESDSELLMQISKGSDLEEESLLKTSVVSEIEVCDEKSVNLENNGEEGNQEGGTDDASLLINETQMSRPDVKMDISITEEDKIKKSIGDKSLYMEVNTSTIEADSLNITSRQVTKTVHESTSTGKALRKSEDKLKPEEVSSTMLNEPKENPSVCKSADFENLISSSTISSIERVEVDSSSIEAESCKKGDNSHQNVSQSSAICMNSETKEGESKMDMQNLSSDSDTSNSKKCSEEISNQLCSSSETIYHVNEQENMASNLNKESKIPEDIKNTDNVELKPSEINTVSNSDVIINEKSKYAIDSCETTIVTFSNNGNLSYSSSEVAEPAPSEITLKELSTPLVAKSKDVTSMSLSNVCDENILSNENTKEEEEASSLDTSSKGICLLTEKSKCSNEDSESSQINMTTPKSTLPNMSAESQSMSLTVMTNQTDLETVSPSSEQADKSKSTPAKEVPAPVRVSARQKQRQAAAAAALAAKEKTEATKPPGQVVGLKKGKKSLSPSKELHIKISGKSPEPGKQSPLISQKSPKIFESKINLQVSPKKMIKEVSQDKLEPITLKLSKEDNPIIVRSSSLSPKKTLSPHSPQGKTLGYTLKIGKDSTTIIPKESTPSPTQRESSSGSASAKADLSGKVGYLIKDTGLTITPVAPTETQEQKLSKITLKLSKAGGHPEIKQENKSETWKAIRKLGEIDIVPVEGKSPTETSKRKDRSEEETPEKKIKLSDVTLGPSTSSGVSKLQGLLTQAPLNQSDSSEDGKFIGFGSPSEKVSPSQQQQQTSYDIGMIRHDDSPQPPRKRGRPRKITSPDDIVHSVSVSHSLPTGLTAKDILAASLQHQSLQQHLHSNFQSQQGYQPPEDLDSSQPMVPLFDLFEETYMDPTPPTIFPDQVQPSSEIIMRSARGRPIGRSRRPRGSGLMRGHERGGPRGRPRGSRGIKRMLEEMEALSYPDPDQPITLENIDAEMGPRFSEHAASELTMALLRKSIEGKKEILEKKARRSDGSEEGNSNLDAQVKEMKEKIEAAYQAELKSPGKEGKKKTPEKLDMMKKSPPGLIPLHQTQDERRKSTDGKESAKRKLSEDKSEEDLQSKRKSTDEKSDSSGVAVVRNEESTKEDSQMDVDQPASTNEHNELEVKKEPEPPPKPVKPRPKSKAEIKRIKREKDRLRREAKKLAALEALKAPPPNPCEEDTRMSADLNGDDGEGSGIKKNRMEVGDPEGKEFTVEQIAEYQWPLQGGELYMIQEQISTWLGVKSFQRKYPDLKRRRVEMEERTYLCDSGLVAESMCDLGLTAVSSSEVLDIMFQDFPEQYEELRKHMREKQARELINKQKERKKFEQTLSKSDLKEHAIQSLVSWNSNLNKNRNDNRKCHLDLQTWTIQYPRSKAAKMTRPSGKLGSYPVALIPGQYADYYKRYTPQELRYFPVNTVLYGPLQPNEMHSTGGSDGSQSESEDSSSSDGTSDSSSEGEGEGTEEDEKVRECKTCGAKRSAEAMLQCSQCGHHIHVTCADLNSSMLTHVRKYQWQCSVCKTCQRCKNAKNESKMLFCDLCDRGYHSYCVGLRRVPTGTWTCERCSGRS